MPQHHAVNVMSAVEVHGKVLAGGCRKTKLYPAYGTTHANEAYAFSAISHKERRGMVTAIP